MIKVLQRIVQEVSAAASLDEALAVIVRRVKETMAVDACSIYLNDGKNGHFVLMATDGLNASAVGHVRLAATEGLVGLVAERQEPVNIENVSIHPRHRYFPGSGEEQYHDFLGVPIIHYRKLLGVLVVQHGRPRAFDDAEVAFFVTAAAQLAGAIDQAAASGDIRRMLSGQKAASCFIQGVQGSAGVAIGKAVVRHPLARLEAIPDRYPEDLRSEIIAFKRAVGRVQQELRACRSRMASRLPREARALFDVYIMLLGSNGLIADTLKHIRAGNWAPGALRQTVAEHVRAFDQLEDTYLRARGEDIRALGSRILAQLQPQGRRPSEYPERCVLVDDEVSIAHIAEVPGERLAGIVSVRGSRLSHTAILARALGIPAVMGLGDLPIGVLDGTDIIVDGYQGRVYVNPSSAVREEFEHLLREDAAISAELQELRDLPAETLDGERICLYVNTGLLSDLVPARQCGAEGVGLYRTEFAFLVRESFPGEDEQYLTYRQVLESFAPKSVTMRTLDVGGDKALPYLPVEEANPIMGWRGIRLTLDHPDIFVTQLRAMLRANAGLGNLHLLLPMVSRLQELDEAKSLIERAYAELQEEGRPACRPKIGVMIEVPSAVYQAAELAQRADFLCIGTNDLTQYLLAVDRNNARVASLYDSFHPAVIQAIGDASAGARQFGKPISVCGEMAGNPAAVVLLLGLGIEKLSMTASNLPRIKWLVRSFTRRQAREVLEEARTLNDPRAVRRLITAALRDAGLGRLVRTDSDASGR
ncbi:MAG: phosphoenolpyruvate--protein phosphotransferase [Gammaproteobacteria bacterium]